MPEQDVRSNVDLQGRRFIAAVDYYGGKASMTDIRSRTGLSRDEADWRFRRLDEIGLIEVSRAEFGRGDREPPRVASLTDLARREMERGLLYDIDDSMDDEDVRDLRAEVREFRDRVDSLEEQLNAQTEKLQENEEYIDESHTEYEAHLIAICDALEGMDVDIHSHIDDVREKWEDSDG